jgi:hypothetical protein
MTVTKQTITIGFTPAGGLTLLAALNDAAEYRRGQGDDDQAAEYSDLLASICDKIGPQ